MGDEPRTLREREFIRAMRVTGLMSLVAGATTAFFGILPDAGPCWPAIVVGLGAMATGTLIVSLLVATLIE